MNRTIKHLQNGDFEVMGEVTEIEREPDRICLDCGRLFVLVLSTNIVNEGAGRHILCPRCSSNNHIDYVKAEHEHITIEAPEDYVHPLEEKAREIYERLAALTGWRDAKIRLWFQLPNPLLGNVPPEWMIMNGRAERLEKFIADAEEAQAEYQDYQRGDGSCGNTDANS